MTPSLTQETYLLVSAIALVAGLVQGLTGFGSALVAMPLLLLFLPAKVATPLCLLMGICITAVIGMRMRRHLDLAKILPLFAGCLPGILIGLQILKTAEDRMIKLFLGLLLISYSGFQLFARPRPRRLHKAWGVVAGFLTGIIGAAFSAGGPPTIIYTTMNDWDKDAIKGTLTGFFLATGILTALGHAACGITTSAVLKLLAAAAPAVITGTLAGTMIYSRLSHRSYLSSIYVLLLMMGIMLVFG